MLGGIIFFRALSYVYSKRKSTFNDIINWRSNERCAPRDKIRNKSFINSLTSQKLPLRYGN